MRGIAFPHVDLEALRKGSQQFVPVIPINLEIAKDRRSGLYAIGRHTTPVSHKSHYLVM